MDFAVAHLTGDALIWWQSACGDDLAAAATTPWDNFSSELLAQFADDSEFVRTRHRLNKEIGQSASTTRNSAPPSSRSALLSPPPKKWTNTLLDSPWNWPNMSLSLPLHLSATLCASPTGTTNSLKRRRTPIVLLLATALQHLPQSLPHIAPYLALSSCRTLVINRTRLNVHWLRSALPTLHPTLVPSPQLHP